MDYECLFNDSSFLAAFFVDSLAWQMNLMKSDCKTSLQASRTVFSLAYSKLNLPFTATTRSRSKTRWNITQNCSTTMWNECRVGGKKHSKHFSLVFVPVFPPHPSAQHKNLNNAFYLTPHRMASYLLMLLCLLNIHSENFITEMLKNIS